MSGARARERERERESESFGFSGLGCVREGGERRENSHLPHFFFHDRSFPSVW